QRNKESNAPNGSETETANKPPGPAATSEREQYNGAAGAPQANGPNAQASKMKVQKKPDPQAIQRIKTEHASFRAQPRPDKVPAATFNQNYR
ncbi:hypothetical protein Q8G40_28625, partial [Klebsiella pneumoniae]|uniref:hypothetical protein n=1 Tax=Klebsiella pneumoniae TaxID=573 RepID=UPI0030134E2E